ncbi:MAG: hypothetical protein SNJ77_02670 [Cytophagales bacterium]
MIGGGKISGQIIDIVVDEYLIIKSIDEKVTKISVDEIQKISTE